MIAGNVARRYARAFFDVAGSENQYESCFLELEQVSGLLEDNRNLKDLLSNPVFDLKDKKAVIGLVLQKLACSPSTANFIRLLVDKGRMDIIGEICLNYRKLMDAALGVSRVQVKTAFPLNEELSASLKGRLETLTGKKVEMQVEEDDSLLGGIVVRAGDRLYDGSIKTQLTNMMKLLGEEI